LTIVLSRTKPVYHQLTNKLVFDTVLDVLDNENPNDLLLLAIVATNMLYKDNNDIAKASNIELSMSRVGNLYDSSPTENFLVL